jgi:hypothetical protein
MAYRRPWVYRALPGQKLRTWQLGFDHLTVLVLTAPLPFHVGKVAFSLIQPRYGS